MRKTLTLLAIAALPLLAAVPPPADSACCYFAAKDKDILQPAQKAFLTFDEAEKVETFTVQPKFEGNAADFGMVIPTPSKPKLDEMPRDFFKELAVYTILKNRAFPNSKLLPLPPRRSADAKEDRPTGTRPTTVKVIESGILGSLLTIASP